mmetsp:Transcript_3188/g.6018  ORF Transcript_3188/g.6018 Transcript_3188/m.6018 type:complete len:202 (+) Transcript_3188:600-1205(+)
MPPPPAEFLLAPPSALHGMHRSPWQTCHAQTVPPRAPALRSVSSAGGLEPEPPRQQVPAASPESRCPFQVPLAVAAPPLLTVRARRISAAHRATVPPSHLSVVPTAIYATQAVQALSEIAPQCFANSLQAHTFDAPQSFHAPANHLHVSCAQLSPSPASVAILSVVVHSPAAGLRPPHAMPRLDPVAVPTHCFARCACVPK